MIWVGARIIQSFLRLTDTPADYTGHAGKSARVNSGESAIEFSLPTKIQSLDGTSKIDTDETPGENILRFITDSVERAIINSDGINVNSIIPLSGIGVNIQAEVTINDDQADRDTTIRAVGKASALVVVGSNGRVGINNNSPTNGQIEITHEAYYFPTIYSSGIIKAKQFSTGAGYAILQSEQLISLAGSQTDYLEINLQGNANFCIDVWVQGYASTADGGYRKAIIAGYLSSNVLGGSILTNTFSAGTFGTNVTFALDAKGSANKIRVHLINAVATTYYFSYLLVVKSANSGSAAYWTAEVVD